MFVFGVVFVVRILNVFGFLFELNVCLVFGRCFVVFGVRLLFRVLFGVRSGTQEIEDFEGTVGESFKKP